jgi:hydrogenase maturation protease
MKPSQDKAILLIGYGNTLRGDDALGRHVVDRVAEMQLPHVRIVSVPQLVPELAEPIAEARAVIFVDACLADRTTSIVMHEITDASHFHGASHESGPRELLALAAMCYGSFPQAWLMAVPALDINLADGPSPQAQRVVASAASYVIAFIHELRTREVTYV